MATSAIHPSSCGRYIVSMFGAYPHVIPLAEAAGVLELYETNARLLSAQGKVAAANMEMSVCSMLRNAISEAEAFRTDVRHVS